MDETAVRAAVRHYLDHSAAGEEHVAHEIYHPDAVLEFPQSGERFEGVENFEPWRAEYPASAARRTSGSWSSASATTAGR